MSQLAPPRPFSDFTNVNGTFYFTTYDYTNGRELWKIDSAGNAVFVKNTKITGWSDSSYLTNLDGTLYFTASDRNNGRELWKIDSAGNAVLVKDINPGTDSSFPSDLTNIDGTLYFTASDGPNETELWKIDNAGNAVLVTDINSGTDSSYLSLTNIDGTLYFTVHNTTTRGEELWTIDDTGNAVLVTDINPGNDWSYLSDLTNVNGTLYFIAYDVTNGHELWKIDSAGNAILVKDINPGAASSQRIAFWSSPHFTNIDGTLYFTAYDVTNEHQLWKIDSAGNAVLVKDLDNTAYPSSPSYLTNVNGTLYFTASDAANGTELWKIDSNDNAVLVTDINPGSGSSSPSYLTNVNSTLYFTASDGTNGQDLWKIDSAGNAVLVTDISPGTDSSYPSYLTNIDGTLYFTASDGTNGTELWKIDSVGNAVLVTNINSGTDLSYPSDLRNIDGTLYFTVRNTTTRGEELWTIDDTGNAVLVKAINPEGVIIVDPPVPTLPDTFFNNNMLETTNEMKGVSIQAVSQKTTNKVNEIGFFNVDDRDGKIDGIAPGEAGYIKAAIDRVKSILTTLGGDFFNTDKQEIGLDPNKIYQFFEIENGSLSDVKQKIDRGETPTNVRLSIFDKNGNSPIKVTGNSLQSGYDISINNDELVLKVTKLDGIMPNRPIGSESQGKIEGRIIDLTNYANQSLTVDITTKSDAVYQSQIDFYVVKDAIGTIELADGTTVKPGDANYAMVAIKNAIANVGLQANRIDSKTNQPIAGGLIYAPVVVAQGTLNDFVNNPSNNMHAYFNYVQGNADKVDHFRQIGANTFGIEDMYGGGDRDFNDIVIKMDIQTV